MPESSDNPRQGLFDPRVEHDACGVGFVARPDARPSHALVEEAVLALGRMAHRGGSGCGPGTADGAGLLMPLPRPFVERVFSPLCGGDLPERCAVGQLFLPQDPEARTRVEDVIEAVLPEHGLRVLARREVPIRPEVLQPHALAVMPHLEQIAVAPATDAAAHAVEDVVAFERRLYIARRHLEKAVAEQGACRPGDFHIVCLSASNIVYKGMITGGALAEFYPDLEAPDFAVHFAIFHERYSTNTRSVWRLAQPFRRLAHNGEINTLAANREAMRVREPLLASRLFGKHLGHVLPVLDESGSDSAMLDNALELLLHAGESPAHAAMILLPEPFGSAFIMGEDKRSFYEYHAAQMEPWDGPAALVFTDGLSRIGAVLDRNALRPARWCRTTDGLFLLASEAGVFDIPAGRTAERGRLHPRRMLMVDFEQGRIIPDAECKSQVIYARPYRHWVREKGVKLSDLPLPAGRRDLPEEIAGSNAAEVEERLERELRLYGINRESLSGILAPMARDAQEPIRSMGLDTPLAVLSGRPRPLFEYFKQRFAQVTNPPIDPLREGTVMSLSGFAGKAGNLLEPGPEHYARLRLSHPLLFPADMERLRASEHPAVVVRTIPMLFAARAEGRTSAQAPEPQADDPGLRLKAGLEAMLGEARRHIAEGATLLVLSDAGVDAERAPIPSPSAVSFLHARLTAEGLRHACGLIVDSGEILEVMHIAQLTAFGADAVHPRLVFALLDSPGMRKPLGPDVSPREARQNYAVAVQKGLLKTISRMGISTLRGFRAGRGFEALGLGRELMDQCFPGMPSRIGGIGFSELARETLARHSEAFSSSSVQASASSPFPKPTERKSREIRAWSPQAVRLLHEAVRKEDTRAYREFADLCDRRGAAPVVLRDMLEFVPGMPLSLEAVEPAKNILQRFVGAAMSFGSISPEAHLAVAEAFNRVGGRSNCGEGGLPPDVPEAARSKIRQIASGRFGVDAAYLVGAEEIQIKMAQGAKPGEGGQLPAHKVTEAIAKARHTVPGVTLISPPPHHDIYSIEDLAQLIYDLKRLHPTGRVSVKLVAGPNIGTIAAGVAKAGADGILVSGHDGGTGASPRSAVEHVGLPWELGLAEAHAALVQSGLRQGLRLQVDGLLRTGRDLAVAALLGADEFGFGTAALVSLGCCMLRVCHLGTCSVGVAAQDPRLRAKFPGRVEHLERYLRFAAEDLRGHMARLGFSSLDEMIGRADRLRRVSSVDVAEGSAPGDSDLLRAKTARLDLGDLLVPASDFRAAVCPESLDSFADPPLEAAMLRALLPALRAGKSGRFQGFVQNTDRAVGVRLAGEVAKQYGAEGLRGATLDIHLYGTAGQSLGAFLPHGVSLTVEGEANDYAGKGLCGGRLTVIPSERRPRRGGECAAVGNVALYGATAGEFFAAGSAGGRFAVRNAGVSAVVEGVGDHACEYMTGGVVVVLGRTGCNFAAGMSGGAAFVFDRSEQFQTRCNLDGVDLESVRLPEDIRLLRDLLIRHHKATGSALAAEILDDWEACLPLFLKVAPIEYRRSLARMKSGEDPHAEHSAATEEVYAREVV